MELVHVGVCAFGWRKRQFLMQRRGYGHGVGTWSLPGGKLEIGETFEAGAARELKEETHLHLFRTRVVAITNDIRDDGEHWLTVWVSGVVAPGDPVITPSCTEYYWATFDTLPSPLWQPYWRNFLDAHYTMQTDFQEQLYLRRRATP